MRTVPADELTSLGPPLQSHATIIGPPVYTWVCRISLALTGVLLLGVSGLFAAFLIEPFGTNPPPREVALGFALGSGILGVLIFSAAVAYNALCLRPRKIPSAYVVFRDAMVAMTSGRPTILRWDDIRSWSGRRTLTATEGRTLDVDPYVKDRDQLVARIESELTKRLSSPLMGAISSGESVAFGPLAINSEGLTHDKMSIPWGAVESLSIQGVFDRRLVVQGNRAFCLALHSVANDFLLLEVASRFLPPEIIYEATPMSRVYCHSTCGVSTVIAGEDNILLESLFRPVASTYCCGCDKFVPLKAVIWADTGEEVAKYRKRLAALVPARFHSWMKMSANAYQGAVNLGLNKTGQQLDRSWEPWA